MKWAASRLWILFALLLLPGGLALAGPLTVEQVPNPRPKGGWVTDLAGVLPAASQQRINQRIDGMERDLGVEVAVVAVPDVQGTPKGFATALFNHWRIGKAGQDNGLLILFVQGRRRLEMETGRGMEQRLPAAWLAEMQGQAMVPAFKRGDFAAGLEAGVQQVEQRLRAPASAAPAASSGAAQGSSEGGHALLGLGFMGLMGYLFYRVARWFGRLFGGLRGASPVRDANSGYVDSVNNPSDTTSSSYDTTSSSYDAGSSSFGGGGSDGGGAGSSW